MSQEKQEWFVAERTKALAMVHLTRRQDLVIKKAGEGISLEYLIYITKEQGEASVRQFGLLLRGTKSPVTETRLDKVLRPTMQSLLRLGPYPFPVCLFHFTMDGDQGHYTWVAEPAVTDGSPKLLMHDHAHCRPFDVAALAEIVAKVDRWYDVFFSKIAVKAS